MPTISVKNLFLERGETCIAGPLSFDVASGQMLLLRGGNGSGKTTLLHYLAGIFFSPCVCIKKEVIFLPTTFALFEDQTVLQNLKIFAEMMSVNEITDTHSSSSSRREPEDQRSDSEIQIKIQTNAFPTRLYHPFHHAIQIFELEPLLHTPVHSLSHGQKRRVSLARLLFGWDRLWLLDESELGLDAHFQEIFLNLICEHLQKGGSVVMASHSKIYEEGVPAFQKSIFYL